jgi:hypothetical protein
VPKLLTGQLSILTTTTGSWDREGQAFQTSFAVTSHWKWHKQLLLARKMFRPQRQFMGTPDIRARLLLGVAIACLTPKALALEAQDVLYFRTGPLVLKPEAAVSETYNDNIYYLPRSLIDDFITTISPGLKLELGRQERNYLWLAYTYDQLIYAMNPSLNAGQHTLDIRDKVESDHITLSGTDRIQFLSNPLGGVERVLTARNIDRTLFDNNYTLAYNVSDKTGVYLRGVYSSLDYQQGIPLYDVDTAIGTAGFAYRAFPKTFFFGELYYGKTSTNPNDPSLGQNPTVNFVGGYAGARGNFTEKLTGSVKVGYESREYSDGSSAPSEPVADIALTQRFTDKTSLTLSYSRQNNVSSQYTRETFTADVIGGTFSQVLGESRKWEATLGANYSHYSYELNGRSLGLNYDYVRGSFSLAYHLQLWLTASLGYDFEQLTSKSPGTIDYTVNRVTLRLAVGY